MEKMLGLKNTTLDRKKTERTIIVGELENNSTEGSDFGTDAQLMHDPGGWSIKYRGDNNGAEDNRDHVIRLLVLF